MNWCEIRIKIRIYRKEIKITVKEVRNHDLELTCMKMKKKRGISRKLIIIYEINTRNIWEKLICICWNSNLGCLGHADEETMTRGCNKEPNHEEKRAWGDSKNFEIHLLRVNFEHLTLEWRTWFWRRHMSRIPIYLPKCLNLLITRFFLSFGLCFCWFLLR